jgi:hypothetical protein
MTSRRGGVPSAPPSANAQTRVSHAANIQERVAELAYELYLARGNEDGHDLDDWLEAERFLQQRDNPPLISG